MEAFAAFITASVALVSCAPYHFTARPGASGRVVDARTSRPISGANITLAATNISETTISGADGAFLVPPKQQWGIYIVPMDPIGWDVHVTIEALGYSSGSREFVTSAMGSAVRELGDIRLSPIER